MRYHIFQTACIQQLGLLVLVRIRESSKNLLLIAVKTPVRPNLSTAVGPDTLLVQYLVEGKSCIATVVVSPLSSLDFSYILFFNFVLVLSGYTSYGFLFEMMELCRHTLQDQVDIKTTF